MKQYQILNTSLTGARRPLKAGDIIDPSELLGDHITELLKIKAIVEYVPPVVTPPEADTTKLKKQ